VDKITEKTNILKDNTIYISITSESLLFLAFLFSQFYLYKSFIDQSNAPPIKTRRVKVTIPLLGTIKRGPKLEKKRVNRTKQITVLMEQGMTDPEQIADKIGSHKTYVKKIIAEIGA
jgi:hypothetical protein